MSILSGYTQTLRCTKTHCTHMKQNSNEPTSNSQVDESMKELVLAYIKAKNADDDAMAEEILHEINQLRRLTNDK